MAIHGTELILVRHAPADTQGRLCGRTDVPAAVRCPAAVDRLRNALAAARHRVCSPARRCVETAEALWPGEPAATDSRLAEQDFGEWDGLPLDQVPDLGPLPPAALARHRPPGGESFADLCARARPALSDLAARPGDVAVIAHAGTVRAALALALGDPVPALSFDIVPLSVTRLRLFGDGTAAILCVNCRA